MVPLGRVRILSEKILLLHRGVIGNTGDSGSFVQGSSPCGGNIKLNIDCVGPMDTTSPLYGEELGSSPKHRTSVAICKSIPCSILFLNISANAVNIFYIVEEGPSP